MPPAWAFASAGKPDGHHGSKKQTDPPTRSVLVEFYTIISPRLGGRGFTSSGLVFVFPKKQQLISAFTNLDGRITGSY